MKKIILISMLIFNSLHAAEKLDVGTKKFTYKRIEDPVYLRKYSQKYGAGIRKNDVTFSRDEGSTIVYAYDGEKLLGHIFYCGLAEEHFKNGLSFSCFPVEVEGEKTVHVWIASSSFEHEIAIAITQPRLKLNRVKEIQEITGDKLTRVKYPVDEEDEKIKELYIGDEILAQLNLYFPRKESENKSEWSALIRSSFLPIDNGEQVILKEDKILISIAFAEKKDLKFSYSIKEKKLVQITDE
ncbi:MAG: hypothetical protein ACI9SQ_000360 [Rubritalea sp.]|jgi:hypothetical protein